VLAGTHRNLRSLYPSGAFVRRTCIPAKSRLQGAVHYEATRTFNFNPSANRAACGTSSLASAAWLTSYSSTLGPVALRQGTNVLVFKVVNDTGAWEGCVRLVDENGLPAPGIGVRLTP
jgi:hypothetical protein